MLDGTMHELAQQLQDEHSLMFFARGYNYATALEAALKVKVRVCLYARACVLRFVSRVCVCVCVSMWGSCVTGLKRATEHGHIKPFPRHGGRATRTAHTGGVM